MKPIGQAQGTFVVLLFRKYRGALLRHVQRMVACPDDAAELVQETYLRVMRQIASSRFEAAARAYLFQTATNLVRDHHRRQRYRAHAPLDELDSGELPVGCPPPDQVVAAEQAFAVLYAALLEMPASTRDVFLKARLQHASHAQIGRDLGMGIRTVERRISEALALLHARLADAA